MDTQDSPSAIADALPEDGGDPSISDTGRSQGGPVSRPQALGAPTASRTSIAVAVVAAFALAYGFPTEWLVADRGTIDTVSIPPQGFVPAILAASAGYALLTNWAALGVILKLIASEPLVLTFLMLLFASTLWSAFPAQTLRLTIPLLVTAFLAYWMATIFRMRELLVVFCIVFFLGTLVQYAFVFGLPNFGRSNLGWSGTSVNKNGLGRLATLASLHFTLAAMVFRPFRLFWIVMSILSAILVIGSGSATSLAGLGFVHGMMAVCALFRARKTLYGAIAASLIGGGVLAIFIATANLGILAGLLGKDVTLTGRTVLWQASIEAALEKPILGFGWGGFWQGQLSPARVVFDKNGWLPPHSHNALIDYFLAGGVVGAALAAAFFVRFVVRSARTVRRQQNALGLWPMAFASFAFVFSLTEFGVISRSVFFLLLVIHIAVVSAETRDERGSHKSMRPEQESLQLNRVMSA